MKKIFLATVFTVFLGSVGFGQTPTPTPPGSGTGMGRGDGGSNSGSASELTPPPPPPVSRDSQKGEIIALRITSKPRPVYTQQARENEVHGTVILRVVFGASGKIGSISPVLGLPYGLTEQAIAAAKKIEFEPAKRNGVSISIAKAIRYSFVEFGRYYLDEDDELLEKGAEILEMPVPKLSPEEIKNSGGKIKVLVLLDPQNGASLFKPNADWSKELVQKIREAVVNIKFNPASEKSKAAVTQLKEIEYVFPE